MRLKQFVLLLNKTLYAYALIQWVKGLTSALKGKEQEMEAKDAVLSEEWKRQDAVLAQRRNERSQRTKSQAEEESLSRLQDEMGSRMQRLLLAREAKVIEIERNRAVRLSREQSDEALEAAERSSLLLQKQEMADTTTQVSKLAEQGHKKVQEKLLETVERIREESTRLLDSERVHALRHGRARQAVYTHPCLSFLPSIFYLWSKAKKLKT